jgi:hypothetical protein
MDKENVVYTMEYYSATKRMKSSQVQWCMSVILATQEAGGGGSQILS